LGLGSGEKTREHKDRAQRDAQNREHAGAIYTPGRPDTLPPDTSELSGLPWGSVNMQVVMSRGYAAAAAVTSSTSSPSTLTTATSPVMSNTGVSMARATAPVSYYLGPFAGGYGAPGGYEYYGGGASSGEEGVPHWSTAGSVIGEARHHTTTATTPAVDDGQYYYDYEYEEGQ
jgi:hypothetical protein